MEKMIRTEPAMKENEAHRPETNRDMAAVYGLQSELSFRLRNMPSVETSEVGDLLSPPYFKLFSNLEELLGTLIHDGRNRLGPVKGYASLIETKAEPGSQIDVWTKRIIENVEVMERQLELLSIYRMKGNSIIAEVRLESLIEEAVRTVRMIYKKEIPVILTNEVKGRYALHAEVLKRMVVHVLRNAVESAPDGGCITVAVDYDKTRPDSNQPGPSIIITISDSGRGLSDSQKQAMWKPFFSTKPSHFGLGLPYVLMAATLVGARVDVESREGFGTTVSINVQARGGEVEKP
jgi:signal transduction histidine kinase